MKSLVAIMLLGCVVLCHAAPYQYKVVAPIPVAVPPTPEIRNAGAYIPLSVLLDAMLQQGYVVDVDILLAAMLEQSDAVALAVVPAKVIGSSGSGVLPIVHPDGRVGNEGKEVEFDFIRDAMPRAYNGSPLQQMFLKIYDPTLKPQQADALRKKYLNAFKKAVDRREKMGKKKEPKKIK